MDEKLELKRLNIHLILFAIICPKVSKCILTTKKPPIVIDLDVFPYSKERKINFPSYKLEECSQKLELRIPSGVMCFFAKFELNNAIL